ncbi:unnamed protein product, partial [Laminaria digitata]
RTNLTENQRHRVIEHLLKESKQGKLNHGDLTNTPNEWSCSTKQITRLWKQYQQQVADGVANIDLHNKRRGNSGRKGIDTAKLKEALRDAPLKNRTTQRAVAAELGISQTVLQRNLGKPGMRASTRFLKPLLTEACKTRRLQFAGGRY